MTAIGILNKICPHTLNIVLNQKGNFYELVEAMKEYARIKCEEQRKLCAENAGIKILWAGQIMNTIPDVNPDINRIISDDSIINAPSPIFN